MIIPIFAVERAQELIYYLGRLVRSGRIPGIPVYLDSPMAAEVNKLFARFHDWFDPDLQRRLAAGEMLLGFHGLTTIRTVEESKALNHKKGPAVIMATNGMCTAGRIKHHLAQYIDRPECMILFVGYQGAGTLGRQILDGRRDVRLHGRMRRVKAQVGRIEGFSGHADRVHAAGLAAALRRAAAAGLRHPWRRRGGLGLGPTDSRRVPLECNRPRVSTSRGSIR